MEQLILTSEDVYFNDRWLGDLFQTVWRVGKALAEEISRISGSRKAFIAAGPGNNGNDALCAARFLLDNGFEVKIFEPFKGKSEVREKIKNFLPCNCILEKLEDLPLVFFKEGIFLDGIFGVGQRFPLDNLVVNVLLVGKGFKVKIAIDVPTGVDANSGNIDFTIPFDYTLCIQQPKIGLFLDPAKSIVGEVRVIDAGIKTFKYSYCYFNKAQFSPRRIKRDPSSHKYFYGPLVVIAGSRQMKGASELALEGGALASSRVLVSVAGPSTDPEVINFGIARYCRKELEKVFSLIKTPKCIIFGPGIEETSEFEKDEIVQFLSDLRLPVIVDGTGLKYVIERKLNSCFLLTPHFGEFKYLGGNEKNLHQSLSILQEKYNCNILLKGPVCMFRGQRSFLFEVRKSSLSFAGMGDFLAGLIGGFVCNSLDFFSASYNSLGLLVKSDDWNFKLFREKIKNEFKNFFAN